MSSEDEEEIIRIDNLSDKDAYEKAKEIMSVSNISSFSDTDISLRSLCLAWDEVCQVFLNYSKQRKLPMDIRSVIPQVGLLHTAQSGAWVHGTAG